MKSIVPRWETRRLALRTVTGDPVGDVTPPPLAYDGHMGNTVLLFGSTGLLGKELGPLLMDGKLGLLMPTREDADLSVSGQVGAYLARTNPDVIINAAAWTDVDEAEESKRLVFQVNAESVKILADYSLSNRKRLVHISTASVFSGNLDSVFGPQDPVNPVNTYNESKALAEGYCLDRIDKGADISIIRTYWLYGRHGHSFVDFVASNAINKREIRIVANQWGQPTLASELATYTLKVSELGGEPRVRHGVNRGGTSRLNLARAIYRHFHSDESLVVSTTESDFGAAAKRPEGCILSNSPHEDPNLSAFQDWDSALTEYLDERYKGGIIHY